MRGTILCRLLALPLLLSALAGCFPRLTPTTPKKSIIRSYTIGETRVIKTGEAIVTIQSSGMVPGYVAVRDYQPPPSSTIEDGGSYPPITRGHRFGVVATSSDGTLRIASGTYRARVMDVRMLGSRVMAYEIIDTVKPVEIPITAWGVVSETPYSDGDDWTTDTLFAPTGEVLAPGAFRGELLYTGLDGRMVKASYREYYDGSTTPSYTAELEHDLDDGSILSFQSLEIEILKATGTGLEYRVLADDDLPWLP